jgi:UDP-2,4-diacetamido-2,4,6-trideoxy-beta-L-altropyranose hydrolase
MRALAGVRVTFITEGGPETGLGHVTRCLALARAAVADGARVSFLLSGDAEVRSLLQGLPVPVQCVPWPPDLSSLLDALEPLGSDVVVVDSYRASPALLAALGAAAPVVSIDDMADRPLPVDVVVNGGAGAETLPYARTTDRRLLLGPRYCLLDASYGEAPSRVSSDPVRRVLVCLGGARQVDAMVTVLAAVDRVFAGCVVDVAAGPFSAESPRVRAAARAARNRVALHRDRFGLRELMLSADVAVAGAGMTLHELCATAAPSVAVLMADNQRPNLQAVADAGATLTAGAVDDPGLGTAVEKALGRLAGDRELRATLGARGRALVDGQGAARVARAITRPALSRT